MSGTFENINVPPMLMAFGITTVDAGQVISPELKYEGNKLYLIKHTPEANYMPNVEQLKARETAGVNKSILSYKDFRKALSLSINRADYNTKCTTSSLPGFGLFNSMHYYDVENGGERCIDQNGNEICAIYEFTIGNPSFTTQQNLFGNIKVAPGDEATKFTNLYFFTNIFSSS